MKSISEQLLEVCEEICEKYCKYTDTWDEEKEGVELMDSDLCRDCPLNKLC